MTFPKKLLLQRPRATVDSAKVKEWMHALPWAAQWEWLREDMAEAIGETHPTAAPVLSMTFPQKLQSEVSNPNQTNPMNRFNLSAEALAASAEAQAKTTDTATAEAAAEKSKVDAANAPAPKQDFSPHTKWERDF